MYLDIVYTVQREELKRSIKNNKIYAHMIYTSKIVLKKIMEEEVREGVVYLLRRSFVSFHSCRSTKTKTCPAC